MSEQDSGNREDALNNLRRARGGTTGAKVFVGILAISIAIGIVSIIAGNSNGNSDTSQSSDVSTTQSTDTTVATPDTSWIPTGFFQWPSDANVAFRWAPSGYSCNQYEDSCYKAIFISQNGCPTQFYAAINLLDSSGSVIDYSNGTLPTLLPMQKATIDFQDINGNSKSAQMSEITCD